MQETTSSPLTMVPTTPRASHSITALRTPTAPGQRPRMCFSKDDIPKSSDIFVPTLSTDESSTSEEAHAALLPILRPRGTSIPSNVSCDCEIPSIFWASPVLSGSGETTCPSPLLDEDSFSLSDDSQDGSIICRLDSMEVNEAESGFPLMPGDALSDWASMFPSPREPRVNLRPRLAGHSFEEERALFSLG